jgi:hypothetical protein
MWENLLDFHLAEIGPTEMRGAAASTFPMEQEN